MKIILIELDLQCSMVTHQSALTSILDFFFLSKVATIQQTDSAAHKLKLRLFHKSVHLWVHLVDFHLWYEPHLTIILLICDIQNTDNKPSAYIRLTQKNSIKFLIQSIFLYARLVKLHLTYFYFLSFICCIFTCHTGCIFQRIYLERFKEMIHSKIVRYVTANTRRKCWF